MQEIEFFCRYCRKSMKMAYRLTGDDAAPVMAGMIIRCHTHKCTSTKVLKNFTEEELKKRADRLGRYYI